MREALFNILGGGRFDIDLKGAVVIDIFAGTGALGLEALSRGAAFCYFIERDKSALAVLRRNIDKLGFQECSEIIFKDATKPYIWHGQRGDLILCDAPYDSALSGPALTILDHAGGLSPHCLITVETRRTEPDRIIPPFYLLENRVYAMGRLGLYQLRRAP